MRSVPNPAPSATASTAANAARSNLLDRVLADYRGIAAQLPGDAASGAARSHAAARLHDLGWPSARDELWRYTNLRALDRIGAFAPDMAAGPAAPLPDLPPALPGFERLIYVDGRLLSGSHISQAADSGPGAEVPEWLPEQRLGWLCDMFATDAARLTVAGEAAIEILFVSSGRSAAGAAYPRLQLRCEPGSQVRLVERHLGAAAPASLVAMNVTVELAREAVLNHYRLQQYGRDTVFIDTLSALIGERARYAVRSVAVGAGSARTSARVQLAGRGASLAWGGIAVGRGEQVHDISLKVEHEAPETGTEELFRGIADERSRVAFSGHIRIDGRAPGAHTRQSLRGLIEGASAEIDLRPRLEILTDDVRAQHGATTGRLDEELLFYLLARGIDRPTARSLLKWAFLGDALREIDVPALRAEAERLAAGQLPDVPDLGALA
jgi:Fe-S cluster assembly protein SufD